ncbi:alpha/beta hydrolase [Cesiribacter andamanensis]|uniref:Phospholipase ytpA n=1 Tax=Cesiribacter andamanensis AMV16 TaxID=1279009 RepID=M7N3P5_9BACT|nr:alpha/beta hydrolase [Cesiribacter andamanensis]EMR01917.1 Phospholipase ytpA [Cesiribacter andamanensis AMV16]
MRTESFQLERPGGIRLWAWLHLPKGAAKALVVLVHGLGEHAGRYQQLAGWLQEQGYGLLVWDQRGHGQTGGQRGHADYPLLLQDVEVMLKEARRRQPRSPLFVYGHSMGGTVALAALRQNPQLIRGIRGLVLSAPWLELAFSPPAALMALARLMARVFPAYSQANRLKPEWLSRDPEVGRAYQQDPLVHDRISAGLFCQIQEAGRQALRGAAPRLPMLVLHGTDDAITSFRASQRFAHAAGATFLEGADLRHEQHNEPEGREVLQQVLDWMDRRLKK